VQKQRTSRIRARKSPRRRVQWRTRESRRAMRVSPMRVFIIIAYPFRTLSTPPRLLPFVCYDPREHARRVASSTSPSCSAISPYPPGASRRIPSRHITTSHHGASHPTNAPQYPGNGPAAAQAEPSTKSKTTASSPSRARKATRSRRKPTRKIRRSNSRAPATTS